MQKVYTDTFILMFTGGFNQYVMKLFIANIMSLYSTYLSRAQRDPRKVFLFKYFETAFALKNPH